MRNNNKNQKQIIRAALHSYTIGEEKGRTPGAIVASKAQVLPVQERAETGDLHRPGGVLE